MPIRIANPAARHALLAEEVERAVLEVLRSGRYVGGPVVAQAEAECARRFGRAGAVGVNSGTDALILALQAVGVRPGDEVILPALSFFATAGAVCALEAVPVIVDVREDATLDPEAARKARTARSKAVVPVHLYGTTAQRPDLDLPIVDDSAQAIGGQPPGSYGALSAVSTYPTKTWSAAGDGGFVVGDDPVLLDRVRRLSSHGLHGTPNLHEAVQGAVGRNSRLDAIHAAVLLAQAPRLDAWIDRRRALAARYDAALPEGVRPVPRDEGSPVHQYVVLVEERERVIEALVSDGIMPTAYYPRTLGQQPALADRAVVHACPVAEAIAARALALPVHERLSDEEADAVMAALHDAVA